MFAGLPGNWIETTCLPGILRSNSAGTVPIAGGTGGVPGGAGGAGTSISTIPLWTTEVILPIAAFPPKACEYFAKTSSVAGSGVAGAGFAGAAGAGPDTTVSGAILGAMLGSMPVIFLIARAGKISAAVFSAGAFSPGNTSVGAPFAAPRWHVKQVISRLLSNTVELSAMVIAIMLLATCFSLLSSTSNFPIVWQYGQPTPRARVMYSIAG